MLLFLAGWMHVLLVPYTKVEESFNLHATHDLIFYGPLSEALINYDHFMFPGVVPRSFIGSIALSIATWTAAVVSKSIYAFSSKYELQVLVRLVLTTVNAFGLFQLQRATKRRFGTTVSTMFVLLTSTQFHMLFWMGRTLPNMLALYPVNVASSLLISKPSTRKRFNAAICLLTFATVVLRSELVLLLGPIVLQGLFLRRTSFMSVVKAGLVSGILSLVITVSVDSYFWDRWPLWPEISGLYFNVYEGKSSEWGTSPAYSYFLIHLPKLLLSALPLSFVGLLADRRIWGLLFPCVAFVALLSCLGHKEWRFVVYVVPIWNIAGARGAAWLLSRSAENKSVMFSTRFSRLVLLGLFGLNILATMILAQASMANYPGGEALRLFNGMLERSELRRGRKVTTIHIGNYAAQTGASLFLHEHAPPRDRLVSSHGPWSVIYNKTENLIAPDDFWGFDWALSEHSGMLALTGSRWSVQARIDGLRGVELRPLYGRGLGAKLKIPSVVREPKLWLLKREDT